MAKRNSTGINYQPRTTIPIDLPLNSQISGVGSVTSVSVTTVNGVSGSVATPSTTPAISITLGNITPTLVTVPFEGVKIKSDSDNGYFVISPSGLSVDRAFVVNLTDADRTLDMSGNLIVSADADVSDTNTGDNATNSQYSGLAASKQDTLVSGTNIKTINSNSLLGSGDLVLGGVFNEVSNTLSTNYSLTANSGVVMVSPLTITPGISLTIPSTSKMVILHYRD